MKRYTFWDCRSRRAELSAFESGELAPDRAERLASHLAVCARCRGEWETISGVASFLRTAPPSPAEPPSDLWSRIENQLLEPTPIKPLWRRPAVAFGVGGPVFAAACAGFVALRTTSQPEAPVAVATPAVRVAVVATPTPAPVAVAKVEEAPQYFEPEPDLIEPTPAARRLPSPVRVAPRKLHSRPRHDPFTAVDTMRVRRPAPRETPRPSPPLVAIAEVSAPVTTDASPVSPESANSPETDATMIPVVRPTPSKMALRDVRTDAEIAERRSAAAMESPLDAVDRASRARRLFP